MMPKKKKAFDAVEMSRKWRMDTSRLLATMTHQEQIEFLNRNLERYPKARVQTASQKAAASSH